MLPQLGSYDYQFGKSIIHSCSNLWAYCPQDNHNVHDQILQLWYQLLDLYKNDYQSLLRRQYWYKQVSIIWMILCSLNVLTSVMKDNQTYPKIKKHTIYLNDINHIKLWLMSFKLVYLVRAFRIPNNV